MKHALRIFLVLGAMMVLCLSLDLKAKADTTFVSGTIHYNTTWTPAGNPYLVVGNTRVDTNIVLTIQPGCWIKFNQSLSLRVDGALYARGTPSDSIIFTASNDGADVGWWSTLSFSPPSIDTLSFLEYCRIEKGNIGILCDAASPTIIHCTVTNNGSWGYGPESRGIDIRSGSSPSILFNTISNNIWGWSGTGYLSGGGVYARPGSRPVIIGNIIEGNWISGGTVTFGGGLSVSADSVIIMCNIITGNTAGSYGGGISITGNNVTLQCNEITSNYSYFGGGIYAGGTQQSIVYNVIQGNSSPNIGIPNAAGIYIGSGASNINYNDIHGNADLVNSVFEVYAGTGADPVNGENNWWGTTDANRISLLVYDFWDDPILREFDFIPFSTDSNYPPSDTIIVNSPNGGETWDAGTQHNIRWTASCLPGNVKIEYSTNSGADWLPIVGNTENDGVYVWNVPDTRSNHCRVKVADAEDGEPFDISDADFTITCTAKMTLYFPNGGESFCFGDTTYVLWNSFCVDSVRIEYSVNGGSTWSTITPSAPSIGIYKWVIPSRQSANCKLRICDAMQGSPCDTSNGMFTITDKALIVVDPNGGERWRIGNVNGIVWQSFCFTDSVKIEYSTNGGTVWSVIVDTTTNDGLYQWTIPNTPSDSCLVRISDVVNNLLSDESDSLFSIVTWIRGDANGDGVINVSDVVYLINYLFISGPAPDPIQAGDCNCDGNVNASDVVYLINYLFISGPPPGC